MGNNGITLYKRTHFIASGIFIVLIAVASTAVAMIHHRHRDSGTDAAAVPTVGRFVVTPARACFIEPGQDRAIGKECPAR